MRSINTLEQVEAIRAQLVAEGAPGPEIIRQVALACLGWPYVFGAWGEKCTPAGRKRRARDDHPTIRSKCPALNGKDCSACKWGIGVRMYDCRGFTRWLLQQVGLDIVNTKGKACQTVSNQYNSKGNWVRRGPISEMPDCVCCVFDLKHGHTGMHIGGGTVIDCSVNVRVSNISGYTNYAIHKGLYSEEAIPVETVKPTLRKGDQGVEVKTLQERLNSLGYDCGDADGIFGTRTKNAVVRFQTDQQLDPDGVVGRKTWAALDGAQPEVKFRVVIEGVTLAQYKRILEICPLAECYKESDA